jgi:tetratricopeptide (TPR) repeat protein
MENNLHNMYLFRAMEAYPYELERAIEALNYALSYNPESVKALCLMAKVQNEQLDNYKAAKYYYEKAIAADIENPSIYPDYIRLLVNNGAYVEAEKLIDFALRFKGTHKASVMLVHGYLYEATMDFDKAEDVLQETKMCALNQEFINYVDDVITRVVRKRKVQNNKNKAKETVVKKEVEKTNNNWFRDRLNNFF